MCLLIGFLSFNFFVIIVMAFKKSCHGGHYLEKKDSFPGKILKNTFLCNFYVLVLLNLKCFVCRASSKIDF